VLAFFVVLLAHLTTACERAPELVYLEGNTMGTRYHVTVVDVPAQVDRAQLAVQIDEVLEAVNDSMSTYRSDSEINRVNRSATGEWLAISENFSIVLAQALIVSRQSEGAYDTTVGPLVDLWGFGPQRGDTVPSASDIEAARSRVGYQALELDLQQRRLRKREQRELDFSSLAKGFAVDQLAALLDQHGIAAYLVEIGGEIRVQGQNPRGESWRLAVEKPELMGGEPLAALAVTSGAVATSGNYRNYFEVDGERFSHSINPLSGYPVRHELVSVTVLAENAMLADAWATALTVMGLERALATARREQLAVYLVVDEAGTYMVHKTSAIDTYLQ
jgi:thiamine biosynthesis lipoprotein